MLTIDEINDDDVIYSDAYDAYYNAKTGKWLEKKCSDIDCDFCKNRPAMATDKVAPTK